MYIVYGVKCSPAIGCKSYGRLALRPTCKSIMPHYLEVGEGHKNGQQVLNWTPHAKHLLTRLGSVLTGQIPPAGTIFQDIKISKNSKKINALWPWPHDPEINRAHPCLMASLHVKFHDDRCKGKAVMRQKQFSVIYALWPWPLTFWPQNL